MSSWEVHEQHLNKSVTHMSKQTPQTLGLGFIMCHIVSSCVPISLSLSFAAEIAKSLARSLRLDGQLRPEVQKVLRLNLQAQLSDHLTTNRSRTVVPHGGPARRGGGRPVRDGGRDSVDWWGSQVFHDP